MKYPTLKEMEGFRWYRFGKIAKHFLYLLALSAPFLGNLNERMGVDFAYLAVAPYKSTQELISNGLINFSIWFISVEILWQIILYIIYGKRPDGKEYDDDWIIKIILVPAFSFIFGMGILKFI